MYKTAPSDAKSALEMSRKDVKKRKKEKRKKAIIPNRNYKTVSQSLIYSKGLYNQTIVIYYNLPHHILYCYYT